MTNMFVPTIKFPEIRLNFDFIVLNKRFYSSCTLEMIVT